MNDHDKINYVLFKSDDLYFGIKSEYVLDVLHKQNITSIPLASEKILGLHNLRGKIVTCIDFKALSGSSNTDNKSDYMMIVIQNELDAYSIAIDSVSIVEPIHNKDIKAVPSNLSEYCMEMTYGIYSKNNIIYLLLDYDSLLNRISA